MLLDFRGRWFAEEGFDFLLVEVPDYHYIDNQMYYRQEITSYNRDDAHYNSDE